MKKLLLPLLTIISGFAFGQGSPCPNYQQFGSATTRTAFLGLAQGQKGVTIGRYADTATANSSGCADYYPGTFIVTDNPLDVLWQRNYNATKWISRAGSGSITSLTFLTDSSIVICFADGSCDTIPINNFTNVVNNIVQNFNDSTVYHINDSTLVICNAAGSCDTINLGTSNTYNIFFDSTSNNFYLVTCDTVQIVCPSGPQSCFQQQVCDTILIPQPASNIYQNGVRKFNSIIVEHGQMGNGEGPSSFYHDTWLHTNYYQYNIAGRPTERPTLYVEQTQWSQLSSSVIGINHKGAYRPGWGQIDSANKVNLYINYLNPNTIPTTGTFSGDTVGPMGSSYGYAIMTNSEGAQARYTVNDVNAKQVGVFFDTYTNNTDGVSIFAGRVPSNYNFGNNPASDSTLYSKIVAIFKTDQDLRFPNYPNSRDDGGTAKAFYSDNNGNVKYGPVNGGDVITIINDTTFIICSFGTNLCDTVYVTNIGVLQTVTILNDSTLIVCDSVGVCDTLIVNPTVFAQPITANNGLIMSTPTNVQLGSPQQPGAPLLHQTYIDAGALYSLNINGSVPGTNWVFRANNTGTGAGVYGTALSGNAVAGAATSGVGGAFRATTGIGITASSVSSFAGMFNISPATTNTVASVIQLQRQSSGTAANGIGTKIEFASQTSDGILWQSNEIISKWTTANTPTRVSQYIITGVNNAILADLFTLNGTGETRLNKYGVGTFTAGTATYLAAYKSDGTLMEYPAGGLPGGGSLITGDNGITANTATNVQLGSTTTAGVPFLHHTFINTATFNFSVGDGLTTNASASNAFNFGKNSNISAGDLNTVFLINNAVSGNENFVAGRNMTVAGNTNFVAATDGQVFNTANYSATFGDAPINRGIAALTAGFGNTNWVENAFTIGSDNVNGWTATGTGGTANAYSNSVMWGLQNIGIGSRNTVGGKFLFANSASGDITIFGAGISTGSRMTVTTPMSFNVGYNKTAPDFEITESKIRINEARFQEYKGTTTAAANDLTLPANGNYFTISGSTTINAIITTNWQAGSTIGFTFSGAPLVKHNTAGGAGTATMLLAGSADFQAAAGDNIEFRYDGTNWHEIGRTIAASGSGPTMTADNGLSKNTATNVQLGATASGSANSPLLHTSYINTASFRLAVYGESASSEALTVTNFSGGNALFAQVTGSTAVYAQSNTGLAFSGVLTPSNQNSVLEILKLSRETTGGGGVGQTGIGLSVGMYLHTSTTAGQLANRFISEYTTVTHGSQTSRLTINGVLGSTEVNLLTLAGDGSVKLRPITATAASAITPAEGMLVFVSNTDATFVSIGIWCYQNGAWKAL